ILAKDGIYVIEINPRLTTSYVGLRKILKINIAQAIIESTTQKQLPSKIESKDGTCFFQKVEAPKTSSINYAKLLKESEVASPPFTTNIDTLPVLLIQVFTEKSSRIMDKFSETKNRLNSILLSG
ncbi:MAG: hypothetical protein GX638_13385, partial [Crenarchaeota archaeon]|nr:hypothetical protein [Thermoproteota archaeon]